MPASGSTTVMVPVANLAALLDLQVDGERLVARRRAPPRSARCPRPARSARPRARRTPGRTRSTRSDRTSRGPAASDCSSGRTIGATVDAAGPSVTAMRSGSRNVTVPAALAPDRRSRRQSAKVTWRPSWVQPSAPTPKVVSPGRRGGVMSTGAPPRDEMTLSWSQSSPAP